jgi:hypothetical protein
MKYRVTCWIIPKSGFDLIERQKAEKFINMLSESICEPRAKKILSKLNENHEGMVLKDIFLETNMEAEIEDLMKIIHKDLPEAELASWDKI